MAWEIFDSLAVKGFSQSCKERKMAGPTFEFHRQRGNQYEQGLYVIWAAVKGAEEKAGRG